CSRGQGASFLFRPSWTPKGNEENARVVRRCLYIRELIWGAWALWGLLGRRASDGFFYLFFDLGGTRMVQGLGSIRGKLSRGSFFLLFFVCRGRCEERGKAKLGEK
ncbi:hypothetical protein GQ607_010089, partial [Colletotrichum asianum]